MIDATTLTFAAIAALAFWSVAERLIHTFGLHQPRAGAREWPSSIGIVVSFMVLALFSAFDAMTFHWTTLPAGYLLLRVLGLALLAGGIAVRVVARLHLGRQFSGFIQTTDAHRLVTTGIYRHLRHPAYLGSLLIFVGFPLALGSLGGLVCAITLAAPSIVYRIHIEEHALAAWFGAEYEVYRARTDRVLPGLW